MLAVQPSVPLAVLGVAAITGLTLWAMLRRGSVADRARADEDGEG